MVVPVARANLSVAADACSRSLLPPWYRVVELCCRNVRFHQPKTFQEWPTSEWYKMTERVKKVIIVLVRSKCMVPSIIEVASDSVGKS